MYKLLYINFKYNYLIKLINIFKLNISINLFSIIFF